MFHGSGPSGTVWCKSGYSNNFFNGKGSAQTSSRISDRRIASKRVHMERITGL